MIPQPVKDIIFPAVIHACQLLGKECGKANVPLSDEAIRIVSSVLLTIGTELAGEILRESQTLLTDPAITDWLKSLPTDNPTESAPIPTSDRGQQPPPCPSPHIEDITRELIAKLTPHDIGFVLLTASKTTPMAVGTTLEMSGNFNKATVQKLLLQAVRIMSGTVPTPDQKNPDSRN
jgi:hypothetical protein